MVFLNIHGTMRANLSQSQHRPCTGVSAHGPSNKAAVLERGKLDHFHPQDLWSRKTASVFRASVSRWRKYYTLLCELPYNQGLLALRSMPSLPCDCITKGFPLYCRKIDFWKTRPQPRSRATRMPWSECKPETATIAPPGASGHLSPAVR